MRTRCTVLVLCSVPSCVSQPNRPPPPRSTSQHVGRRSDSGETPSKSAVLGEKAAFAPRRACQCSTTENDFPWVQVAVADHTHDQRRAAPHGQASLHHTRALPALCLASVPALSALLAPLCPSPSLSAHLDAACRGEASLCGVSYRLVGRWFARISLGILATLRRRKYAHGLPRKSPAGSAHATFCTHMLHT